MMAHTALMIAWGRHADNVQTVSTKVRCAVTGCRQCRYAGHVKMSSLVWMTSQLAPGTAACWHRSSVHEGSCVKAAFLTDIAIPERDIVAV